MKIRILALCLIIVSFITCDSKSTNDEKLIICSCEENPDLGDSTSIVHKVKYTYLVYSNEQTDCCTGNIAKGFNGYQEVWENQAPEHPKVWRRKSSSLTSIDAKDARDLGCSTQGKIVSYADMEKNPHFAKEYFPELIEE